MKCSLILGGRKASYIERWVRSIKVKKKRERERKKARMFRSATVVFIFFVLSGKGKRNLIPPFSFSLQQYLMIFAFFYVWLASLRVISRSIRVAAGAVWVHPFPDWVILHCTHGPHLYPFIHLWTHSLIPNSWLLGTTLQWISGSMHLFQLFFPQRDAQEWNCQVI